VVVKEDKDEGGRSVDSGQTRRQGR